MRTPLPDLRPTEPLEPPDYPLHAGEPLFRELDPTEWNMERLNRVSNGAGCAYQVIRGRGPLETEALRTAVADLSARHPLLRSRIVRLGEGERASLAFSDGRTGPEPVIASMNDLQGNWTELIERDMNAGPSPCWRTSPFRISLVRDTEDPDHWLLVVAGPHAFCDGISLAALGGELLRSLSGERIGGELELRSIPPSGTDAAPSSSSAPVETPPPRLVAPEAQIPAKPERAALVHTGLVVGRLDPERTLAMVRAGKTRGITAHGAIGAAVHLAHAARHAELTDDGPYGNYRSGSPVNLRPHVSPALAPNDLRMAVDVAFVNTPVLEDDTFWGLAERFGGLVKGAVSSGAVLASWDETERRDRQVGSVGVPLLLISNIGRSNLAGQYGDLHIEDVGASMATHGMFQINMAFTTFAGSLGGSFYFETPTVSKASMRSFVDRTFAILGDPAIVHGDPTIADLLG